MLFTSRKEFKIGALLLLVGVFAVNAQKGTFNGWSADVSAVGAIGTTNTMFVGTADALITNTNVETTTTPTGIGTMNIPSGLFAAGSKIHIHSEGVYSAALAPGSLTVNLYVGAVKAGTFTLTNILSLASAIPWFYDGVITCRSITSNVCTAVAAGGISYSITGGSLVALAYAPLNNGGNTFTFPTDQANLMKVTVQWVTASTSNTIRVTSSTMYQEN